MQNDLAFASHAGINSQRGLAKKLGVQKWTLSKTLRGHGKNPLFLTRLARILKVPPELIKAA
ncbi:MAG: helix-turn-helix domain-containing protein [Candidatus Binatia bacterium]